MILLLAALGFALALGAAAWVKEGSLLGFGWALLVAAYLTSILS